MNNRDPKILPVEGSEPKIPYSLSESPRSFLIIFDDEETTPLSPLIIIDNETNVMNTISRITLDKVNLSFGISFFINFSS